MKSRVITGDCLAVMPTLDADSFDAIVSDPPYGLSFMGKAWDHGVPGVEFWTDVLRVAKPGAHLVKGGSLGCARKSLVPCASADHSRRTHRAMGLAGSSPSQASTSARWSQ